ncbi:MAG: ASKHA domain-containing protein [Verrucomicrobia bacterium]|nr:ASKHA domain-containing protein [Verrucomicrobiota bacterium]MDA1088544.1 ASKHA domain-containing protein [Verrucomicrobiota bacterium]
MSITLDINHRRVDAPDGETIFECAEKTGIQVPTSCLKQGKCRECMVEVLEGLDLLSERTSEEGHLPDHFRLSCRTHFVGTSGTVRCHTMRRSEIRIDEGGMSLPGIEDGIPLDPAVTRDGDRILLDGVEIAQSAEPIYGVAVDVGTTTVVMRLVNLETGEIEATQSFENPQRFGGSDIMARIHYDTHHKGKLLQRTLLGYMNRAIEDFPCDPQTIYEMVMVGNATMRDLFFGLDVESIGQKPYRSTTEHELLEGKRESTSLAKKAKTFRFPTHPDGRVYGLPLISGHVGADTAACILAANFHHEKRTVGLMDIGTNTELVISDGERCFAASCPAGPAFEGGSLTCGMPGLEGAIERIHIDDDGSVKTEVIGDIAAAGICGSGLIDVLGELVRTGRMNEMGRLSDGATSFVVDAGEGVSVTERDIGDLAQAKGANASGLQIVFETAGLTYDDFDVFYLAGAFARHIDIEAAKRIGLIPNMDSRKLRQIGNAAIEGATLALLSRAAREEAEKLVRGIKHVELETHPLFFDYFVDGCQYKPVDLANDD